MKRMSSGKVKESPKAADEYVGKIMACFLRDLDYRGPGFGGHAQNFRRASVLLRCKLLEYFTSL
jgi:hypothetical protein